MAANRKERQANPIKDMGASKRRTREIADHRQAGAVRKRADQTVTGQGGSNKGRRARGEPGTGHISERGGVHADAKRPMRTERKGKTTGAKTPGSGLAKGPSRSRAGAAAAGGRTRTGRDSKDNARGRARGGSRTRGRTR